MTNNCTSSILFRFGLSVVLSVLISGNGFPEDWPNWNGPTHDGHSSETGFANAWPKQGLPIEWTCEIGTGFSSMAVVGDRLLAMGHQKDHETVWCLNSQTSEVIWSHSYPGELLPNLHEGGPAATPTVDGDRVYTVGKEGQLFCLNLAYGSVLWEKKLQEDLGVKTPEWGFSSSPRILDDQLLLEAGRVVSYNKLTGEKQWQTDLHDAGYGSVAPFSQGDKTLLATLDCDGLRIVDSANGDQIAFSEWKSPYRTNSTTPIVVNDQIFISTGYKVGCALFRLQGVDLKLIYKNTEMRNHFNNSVLHNGWLYGLDGDSHNGRNVTLNCINIETGKLAWKQRGLGCGSLLVVDDKLLVLAETGDLVLAEASSKSWKELARTRFLKGRCWTAPLLANGRVYGRNADGTLVCVSLPKNP